MSLTPHSWLFAQQPSSGDDLSPSQRNGFDIAFSGPLPDTYAYESLERVAESPAQIRLLTVLSGTKRSIIHCSLSIESIPCKVKYEALSYVWGDASHKKEIIVDGRTLGITPNLETALQHLRYADRDRVLWIDAICIDQRNLEERSKQVLHMKSVFEDSDCVLMWLGPADEKDEKVLVEVSNMQRHVDNFGYKSCKLCPLRFVTVDSWARIGSIFTDRPYWERRWIVQEVLVAKNAKVVCGTATFSVSFLWGLENHIFGIRPYPNVEIGSQKLVNTPSSPAFNWDTLSSSARTGEELKKISMDAFLGLWSLLEARKKIQQRMEKRLEMGVLLNEFEHCQCGDKKDFIYALLGISKLDGKLFPDYSLSIGEAYRKVTKAMILDAGNLDILCDASRRAPSKLAHADKPSWVPDWSIPAVLSRMIEPHGNQAFHIRSRKGLSKDTFDSEKPQLLKLEGILFDKLTDPSRPKHKFSGSTTNPDMIENFVRSLEPADLGYSTYPTGERAGIAFWRTLLRYEAQGNFHPLDYQTETSSGAYTFEYGWELFARQHRFASSKSSRREKSWRMDEDFLASLSGNLNSWNFSMTESRYMGLVPKSAEAGDIVAVVDSCSVPLVLREVSEGRGVVEGFVGDFELIGPCYIHGIMNGQVPKKQGPRAANFPSAPEKRSIILS